MNTSLRHMLAALITIWILAALSAIGVFGYATHLAQRQLFSRLTVPARAEAALEALQLADLRLRADHLARDPAFVDYVAQSLVPNPARGNAIDSASIADLLTSRRKGYDLALVLDPNGKPAARSGTLLASGAQIQSDPAIAKAIATLDPQQEVRVEDGRIILVAVEPLLRGGAMQGVLYAAKQLDSTFAATVGRIADAGIALVAMPAPVSEVQPESGLSPELVQAIPAGLAAMDAIGPGRSRRLVLHVDGQSLPAVVSPLRTVGGRAALVALDPDFAASRAAAAVAWPLWLAILVLAGIASGGALVRWRRTDVPLERVCAVLDRGVSGDHELVLHTQGSAAMRRLRDQLNALLAQASTRSRS